MFTVRTPTRCWPCQVAVTPILDTSVPVVSSGLRACVGGFGGTWVCSVGTRREVSRRGTVEPRSGGPNLSDCPGMGAGMPRRIGIEPHGEHLRLCHTLKGDDDGDSSHDLSRGMNRLFPRKLPRGQAPRLSRGLPFYPLTVGGEYSPFTFSVPRFKRTSTGAPPSFAFCRRRRYCKPMFLEAL